jgi:hypothetical protein
MTEEYTYKFTNRADQGREFTTDELLTDDQMLRIARIISEDNDGDVDVTFVYAVMKTEIINNVKVSTWL